MKNLKTLFVIRHLAILMILFACNSTNRKPMLPSVTGKPGDLAIVIDKADWNTEIGEKLRNIFEEPFQVLPQYEPIFNILPIPHDAFNSVMQPQRNVIMVDVSPRFTESKMVVQKDIYAKSQVIVDLYAKDDSAFIKILDENARKIVAIFEDAERTRLMDSYKHNLDENIYKYLRNKRHISLLVPKGYKMIIDSSDFIWMRQEIGATILGIFIYEYNYTDTNTFTSEYLINKRNQFLKKYVEGEVEGSYMTTEREFGPVFSQYMLRGERYVAELRGLWKVVNGIAMGGPFMSITTLDEKRNKIVTVEGFVFAAGENKRNYLRQVDAVVLSLEILNDTN